MSDDSSETRHLLKDLRLGDESALVLLILRHNPSLRHFLSSRFDSVLQSRIDVSDLVQETRAEVIRRIGDYINRRPMPFRAWLFATAYERLLKARRHHIDTARRSVRRELPLPD